MQTPKPPAPLGYTIDLKEAGHPVTRYEVRSAPYRLKLAPGDDWVHGDLVFLDEDFSLDGGWTDEDPRDLDYDDVWVCRVASVPIDEGVAYPYTPGLPVPHPGFVPDAPAGRATDGAPVSEPL